MINILLVEEQRLFSEGIQALLSTEDDIHVTGVATSKREILEKVQEDEPDIILANLHMNKVNGTKLIVHMKENYPHIKTVLFTSILDEEKVIKAILAGVDGLLVQNINAATLIHAIRNAYDGQVIFSGEVAKMIAQRVVDIQFDKKVILKRRLDHRNIELTRREIDVAYLLTEHKSNSCIAKKLHLSEGTVKNYVSNLYQKLHLQDREEMIQYITNLLD